MELKIKFKRGGSIVLLKVLVSETLEWMYIYTSHSLGFRGDSEWLTFAEPFFLLLFALFFCEKNTYVESFCCVTTIGSSRPFVLDFLVRVDTVEGVIIW